jgi:hypothetical protein
MEANIVGSATQNRSKAMPDAPFELSSAAVANASLMLTVNLMRFLRTQGKLADQDVAAIYEATLACYENPVLKLALPAPPNWNEQIRFILNSACGEVLR